MPAPPRPLTVITGGGRGIGAATAIHLISRGHDIVVGYLGDAGSAEKVTATAQRSAPAPSPYPAMSLMRMLCRTCSTPRPSWAR